MRLHVRLGEQAGRHGASRRFIVEPEDQRHGLRFGGAPPVGDDEVEHPVVPALVDAIDLQCGVVEVHLTASADDADQAYELLQKYKEIADSLAKNKIKFTYEFNPSIHDRSIRCDNGWSIFPGRGFDIFQKPESKYELSEVNQLRRKCKETEIIFMREEQN